MGNCTMKVDDEIEQVSAVTRNDFTVSDCVGKGGFGKVWKVERKKNKQMYAMKEMSKA
jgi:serine/threonine protein kinase